MQRSRRRVLDDPCRGRNSVMLTQGAFLIVGTRGREAENSVVDRRRVCMRSKTVLGDVVFVGAG